MCFWSMIQKVSLFLILGFILFILIGFAGIVSAECDDNQTILRLYNENNSHVQVWDFGDGRCVDIRPNYNNYCEYGILNPSPDSSPIPNEFSCSLAGFPCIWNSSSEKCIVNNSAIGIVDCSIFKTENICGQEFDSCEWQSGQEYGYEVCYDKIFGATYSGAEPHPETCDSPVLWLEDYSNSHASVPFAQSGSLWNSIKNSYSIPVCYGDLVCRYTKDPECNDKERLVVRLYDHVGNSPGLAGMNSHVSNGEDKNYLVKVCCKSGVGLTNVVWQNLRGEEITDADLNDTVKLVATGSGLDKAGTKFIITQKRGGIFDRFIPDKRIDTLTSTSGVAIWKATQPGEYKFKSVLLNTQEELESVILNVSNVINNTSPVIEILFPACNYSLFLGETIKPSLKLDDPDDYISGTLDLGDGTRIFIDSLGANSTYEHTYTRPGNMPLVLVTSNERSRTIKRVSNIMVIDGSSPGRYLAACVDKPEDLSYIPDAEVRFIAKSTRAIEYIPVSGVPNSISGINNLDIESVLRETWKFSDIQIPMSGLGYDFTYVFVSPGPNWAELTVDFLS